MMASLTARGRRALYVLVDVYRRFEAQRGTDIAAALAFTSILALVPLLASMLAERPAAWWLDGLERAGVPCGPINDLAQVFDNEQVRARGLRVDLERDDAGLVPRVGSPLKMSETPPSYRLAPPRLGEHSHAILTELGYDAAAIASLRSGRAVPGPA